MNTEKKKALLADVQKAMHALGRILDGGHDFSQSTFPQAHVTTLRDQSLGALCVLGMLEARLLSEIGTDNL